MGDPDATNFLNFQSVQQLLFIRTNAGLHKSAFSALHVEVRPSREYSLSHSRHEKNESQPTRCHLLCGITSSSRLHAPRLSAHE
jgi:hypothetical protein